MTKIYNNDPSNLLIRNIFNDWPKDKIAQIYSNPYFGEGDFCGNYYEINKSDRNFGKIFYLFKPFGTKMTSGGKINSGIESNSSMHINLLFKKIFSGLIKSGYWEELFAINFSKEIFKFVDQFQPKLLYNQGYSIGFTNLTLKISEYFNIPILYFPVDDWQESLYKNSLIHSKVDKVANLIADKASIRLALGPKMTEELSKRYQLNFECLYHSDKVERFQKYWHQIHSDINKLIIGYSGNLYLGRTDALLDLYNSCKLLNKDFLIKIFCPDIPIETPKKLLTSENVIFLPLPNHDELPKILSECDVLFLPESFDPAYKKEIQLSLSTKSHLYMMIKKPILLYAPPYSGVVDYAKRYEWAYIVETRNQNDLLRGIEYVINPNNSAKLTNRALEVAKLNHDVEKQKKTIIKKINKLYEN